MFKNALLIYNEKAGQTGLDEIMESVIPILIKGIDNLTLSKTKEPGDGEKIARENGGDYDIIISLGGDGTLHEIINGIAELENIPIVGLLPGGTCNDLARSLNIPLKMEEAAETIVDGKIKDIDMARVNGRYFTNFVGLGLITEVSENIDSDVKEMAGRMGYYISALRSLGDRDDFQFVLKTDGERIKGRTRMIAILNGYHVGSTKVPIDDIDMSDGLLDVFIIDDIDLSLIIKYLLQKENFEETISGDAVKHIKAKNIRVETFEEMEIDTDGKVYLNTPIDVSLVDKKFKFITL